jgi:hypothetical protein
VKSRWREFEWFPIISDLPSSLLCTFWLKKFPNVKRCQILDQKVQFGDFPIFYDWLGIRGRSWNLRAFLGLVVSLELRGWPRIERVTANWGDNCELETFLGISRFIREGSPFPENPYCSREQFHQKACARWKYLPPRAYIRRDVPDEQAQQTQGLIKLRRFVYSHQSPR